MTNFLKIAIVFSVSIAGCWALVPRAGVAAEAERIESSAALYRAHCAKCHGADGQANTEAGRETDADALTTGKVQGMSNARMAQIIRSGKGDMPSFRKLSAAQINSIVRYVKAAF